MALTWPVDGTGTKIPVSDDDNKIESHLDCSIIQDLQWPLEGYFIPGVPPIKSLKSTQSAPVCTFENYFKNKIL